MQCDKLRSREFGRTTDLWVFEIHLLCTDVQRDMAKFL